MVCMHCARSLPSVPYHAVINMDVRQKVSHASSSAHVNPPTHSPARPGPVRLSASIFCWASDGHTSNIHTIAPQIGVRVEHSAGLNEANTVPERCRGRLLRSGTRCSLFHTKTHMPAHCKMLCKLKG